MRSTPAPLDRERALVEVALTRGGLVIAVLLGLFLWLAIWAIVAHLSEWIKP